MPEFDLIEKYLKPLAKDEGSLGLVDDAAILNASDGCSLVLSKDMMVEGVHFDANTSVENLAKKLLRVNLSDLAAMGARPKGYLLGLGLPSNLTTEQTHSWLASFTQGLAEDQELYDISLLGGDTVSADGKVVLSLTIIGEVQVGTALRRTGAMAGDVILVTGSLGDGALALYLSQKNWQLDDADRQYITNRLHLPQPRVEVGLAMHGLVNSAIDVSDGLLADLDHVLSSSNVGAEIYLDKLPLSRAAKECLRQEQDEYKNFWPLIYGGGDDYELILTAPRANLTKIKSLAENLSVAMSEIGVVKDDCSVNLLDKGGNEILPLKCGYEHFAK